MFVAPPVCWRSVQLPRREATRRDEGHEIVRAIASDFLQPATRQKAFTLLAKDSGSLTVHDVVSETAPAIA